MTNPTPHGQVPEALRLAYELEIPIEGYPEATELERNAAAELRRLHAYCQELEAQVIRDCMTHVQNPAENEHVAGDLSKNSAKKNMNVYAELPQSVGDHKYGGGLYTDAQMLAFADATHALRTQQPAPATQQAGWRLVPIEPTQAMLDAMQSGGWMVGNYRDMLAAAPQQEAQEPAAVVVPCHTPSGKRVALYSAKQDLPIGTKLYTGPQPSPTAQAAESVPAVDHNRIREIFMAHGFTVKEGQTDLKQYVYDAAEALLRAARKQGANHD